jgi:proton-coupled amino acid transporter
MTSLKTNNSVSSGLSYEESESSLFSYDDSKLSSHETKDLERLTSFAGVELQALVGSEEGGEENQYDATSSQKTEGVSDIDNDLTKSHAAHGEFGVGNSSQLQVAVNIFISFVGCGMLGMPFAFKQSGWILGILTLGSMSALNVYAMLLIVSTRKKLESQGHTDIFGYGDVGRLISGRMGQKVVDVALVISQMGFATAYIIFIAANLNDIYGVHRAYVCFGCVPILAILVQIQNMKHLSPFSLVADVANLTGLCAVMFQDFTSYKISHEAVVACNYSNILYIASVSLYALEGVGLVLPLESSCADRNVFPSLLRKTIFGITSLMAIFGCFGYFAFGSDTEAPITLNLEGSWATVVKLALCVGLYLTFPVMLFPVNEVMEDFVLSDGPRPHRPCRTSVVLLSAFIAYIMPDFGKFLSLVGASICSLLGLILPGYFHLRAYEKSEMKLWQLYLDYFLIIFGIAFGLFGTYDSFVSILNDD